MMHPDQLFKNTLYNYETPLEGKASFQGVMQKRKNKRRVFFWFSLSSVLLLLISLTAASVFISKDANTAGSTASTGVTASTMSRGSQQSAENDALADAKHNDENVINTPAKVQETSDNTAGPVRMLVRNDSKKTNKDIINQNTSFSNESSKESIIPKQIISGILSNETSLTAANENNAEQKQIYGQFYDWVRWIAAKGIAEELVFEIDPSEGIVLPEFVPYYPPHKSRFNPIFELNVTTAGNGYKYFRESQDVTVAGNHRFSQYHGVMLFDLGRGITMGGGLGYMESVGIGKALISEWNVDTNLNPVRITKAYNVSYRMNKVLLPVAFRYQLGFGRSLVRISATAMPGVVTLGSGTLFNRNELQSMDAMKKHSLTLDARLGAGLYYQVAPKTAISAEPMVQYQSIPGSQWKSFSRFGFGFGLGVVFKP
ncbi:MAG: hypothetical protein ACK5FT_04975 [Sphingomonadales bacterium]|jgi:hypothetical protein